MSPRPTILITRPAEQARRFTAACSQRFPGADLVISPIMRIVTLEAPDLSGDPTLILTSENAVRLLPDVLAGRAYAVGTRTAAAALSKGLTVVDVKGSADDLVARVLSDRPTAALLHLHGRHTRGKVVERLQAAGLAAQGQAIYDQQEVALDREAGAILRGDTLVLLPIFSPRSAHLVSKAAFGATAPLRIAALSAAVLEAWRGPLPEKTAVAKRPDAAHLLDAMAVIFPPAPA